MGFPELSNEQRVRMLEAPVGRVRVVIDTDTYNEIDDQFALVWALLSEDRLNLEAIYATPFHNDRSSGPADGMQRSYDEIQQVLQRLNRSDNGLVYRGSEAWLPDLTTPVKSAAAEDLVARARATGDEPLYVVAIGALTNVASALLLAPDIISKIVVVWLGGQPTYWHHVHEFNLEQDLRASRVLFDSGVPVVLVPCLNVAEHIKTTQAELAQFLKGRAAIGDFLFETYSGYYDDHYAISKEIWDLAPVAWLLNPDWAESVLTHSPILTNDITWSIDPRRHLIREVIRVKRDAIFGDLFRKIEKFAAGA